MTCVLTLAKVLTYANMHVATDQENIVQKGRGSVFCVLLPLPSTKGDMQIITTINIGRHKQSIVYTYNRTGYQLTRKDFP